jgi:hypothetical protein
MPCYKERASPATAEPDRSVRRSCPLPGHRGTALVEVLVAAGIGAVALGPVAALLAVAASSLQLARETSLGTALAMRKMEQLSGALWAVDADGLPISDRSTDFTASPPPSSGGQGLTASPPGVLEHDRSGYVDYLSADGTWVGAGATPPSGSFFVRRWSIVPVPGDPSDTLVLQVLVVPRHRLAPAGHVYSGREPGVVRIVSVRTRRSP